VDFDEPSRAAKPDLTQRSRDPWGYADSGNRCSRLVTGELFCARTDYRGAL